MPERSNAPLADYLVTDCDVPYNGSSCAVCGRKRGSEHLRDCWLGQLHNGELAAVPRGV